MAHVREVRGGVGCPGTNEPVDDPDLHSWSEGLPGKFTEGHGTVGMWTQAIHRVTMKHDCRAGKEDHGHGTLDIPTQGFRLRGGRSGTVPASCIGQT